MSADMDFEIEGGTANFVPAPAGLHPAWCCGLVDLGTQTSAFQNKVKKQKKVYLFFELPTQLMEDGKPFIARAKLTASTDERATLRKWLESWRTKPFTKEEIEKFQMANVIGKACQVMIQHKPKPDGGVWDNVTTILPAQKGPDGKILPLPPMKSPVLFFSIKKWDQAKFDALPAWLQDKIREAPEARPHIGGQAANVGTHGGQQSGGGNSGEEIPF